jgi:hypothetical protein
VLLGSKATNKRWIVHKKSHSQYLPAANTSTALTKLPKSSVKQKNAECDTLIEKRGLRISVQTKVAVYEETSIL